MSKADGAPPQPEASSSKTTLDDTPSSPSTSSFSTHVIPDHARRRYDQAVQGEMKRLEKEYPSIDEVPGCMTLFDEFLSCYALGPQIRHVYRHGTINTCDRRLEDFKFCMSLKGEEEDVKRRAWIRRRAEWWSGRRVVEKSSENVWEERRTPLTNFPPKFDQRVEEDTVS